MLIDKCYKNALITLSGLLLLSFGNVAGQEYGGDIRLRGGQGDYSGRVEIYHDGQWGTVCDDYWDINDAEVTCRQLGYQSAVAAYSNAFFGEGTGEIFLDDVQCVGYETRLENCENPGWYVHNCGHHEDAGVECSYYVNDGDIRLRDGANGYSGRVEIYHDGQWGTVCDDSWDINDAHVTCRQLGYQSAFQAYSNAFFGEGTGEIFLDNVQCAGYETRLENCENLGWSVHNCGHHEDAGVECLPYEYEMTTPYWWWNDGDVRLVEGSSPFEGRVEVYHDGKWNTVCDDDWDIVDADVVCRQLGYRGAEEALSEAYFGAGEGDIILDNVRCFGWEPTLLECQHYGLYEHNCFHSEDAGVRCERNDFETTTLQWWRNDGDVRLVEGSSPNEGRVEVYYDGQWNTVCDDYWDTADANVVCRQLGYEGSAEALDNAYFGAGDGEILLDNVHCDGWESTLLQCSSNELYEHDCSHGEDAGVRCESTGNYFHDGSLRLVDGNNNHSGRVEIRYNGEWGTVCDDGWTMTEADIVCKQLGHRWAIDYLGDAYFGEGSGQIMLDDLSCDGSEHALTQCDHSDWYNHNCNHNEDVSVICAIPEIYQPRLVGGNAWYEGRVEVWDGSRWEKMCVDDFYHNEASTVCRQIGFSGYDEFWHGTTFGSSNAPASNVAFDCDSDDHQLSTCFVYTRYNDYCGNVALRCELSTSINGGVIAVIVIVSVFVVVCISVGLLVSYQHSKKRIGTQPRVAVVSGRTNLSGPSASQYNHCATPPTYYEVMSSPMYRGHHVAPPPLQQTVTQSSFSNQPNHGHVTTGQPAIGKPEFVYSNPVSNHVGFEQSPPDPGHLSHNVPAHGGPSQPLLIVPTEQPSLNQETLVTNSGTDY